MRKKNFIGLSILLLVFLLGLSSTSYATDFTETELKNIFYNSLTNFGDHDTQTVIDAIDNFDGWSSLATYTQNYNYTSIACPIITNSLQSSANYTMLINFNDDQNKKSMVNYYYSKIYYSIRLKNGVITYGLGGSTVNNYIQQNGYNVDTWRYNDLAFYNGTGSNATTVTLNSGHHPSDIDIGYYRDEHFDFTYNDNLETIYIDSFGNTPIRVLDFTHGACYTGYVQQRQYLQGVSLVRYIYSTVSNSWVILDQNSADTLLSKEVEDDKYKIYVNTNINNIHGSIYMVTLISNSIDFENIRTYFYIKTKNDSVLNGGLVSPIFSGDPDYEDQNKHADTIDKIKDVNDTLTDDSQVDNILADNFSGDNLMGNLGYSPLENPFTTIIINTVSSFTDALLDSGNETLSFTVYNSTITLHSEDFTIPAGTLKSFLSLLFNGFLVYEIIKYGFQLYEWINSGRLQNLVNETNNHQYYLF